jgi:hypothetical protein
MDAVKKLVLALLVLLPSLAAACPNCVGQSNRNTTVLKIIGAFMLVPFLVFYVIWRVIKSAEHNDLIEK